jgi:hypothetical protein
MAANMGDTHIFKVGDFVIKKDDRNQVVPIECVITKIGYHTLGTNTQFKEFYLNHLYSDEQYVCSADRLILIEQEPNFDLDSSFSIPSTQEMLEIKRARRINRTNCFKEQTLTQMQRVLKKSTDNIVVRTFNENVGECSHAQASSIVENESFFEGATQAIIKELDTSFDYESPFEGSTQAISDDLCKPLHFVDTDPFEGDTADILQELDKPFID